jgi:sigma-B regulation protein RsbU (phosphoserine phosphatase)
MPIISDEYARGQLLERRRKLESVAVQPDSTINRLLEEVDAALARVSCGTHGLCEYCHDPIEVERLIADPCVRFCLDHLTVGQRDALEKDLELAGDIQRGLLPCRELESHGWRISYHYEPAGVVSGDYCDIVQDSRKGVYFMLGDVSGKGVAASMLMAHLNAMFRTLISVGLPLKDLVQRASHVFSQSTLPTHYATLVCGRAASDGEVEVCNAGHLAPLVVRNGSVSPIEGAGLPVGMFCDADFSVSTLRLEPDESMVLYTDGVSEATDTDGAEYGSERLTKVIAERCGLSPTALVGACRDDLHSFRNGSAITDDVTILALRRVA